VAKLEGGGIWKHGTLHTKYSHIHHIVILAVHLYIIHGIHHLTPDAIGPGHAFIFDWQLCVRSIITLTLTLKDSHHARSIVE
jgi:hypothetical protein